MERLPVISLIQKYIPQGTQAYVYYMSHAEAVKKAALSIADHNQKISVNREIVFNGAMLHDIGICKVSAPEIGCFGDLPYLSHGFAGNQILEMEGYYLEALIAERHTGVGITKEEVIQMDLPMPKRDLIPISMEEKLVCFADCFFSKSSGFPAKPKNLESVRQSIERYGSHKRVIFDEMEQLFNSRYIYQAWSE